MQDMRTRLLKHMNAPGNHGFGGKAIMKVALKGDVAETFASGQWIPAAWAANADTKPAGLSSYGTPWMVTDRLGVFRNDFDETPLPGIGQLWIQRSGARWLLAWPVRAVLEKGCSADDSWAWVWGGQEACLQNAAFSA